jgi:hypothetical protein
MEFTLHYRGRLKPNGSPSDKHKLRRRFHRQLSVLWNQPPLSGYRKKLLDTDSANNIIKCLKDFNFAPLVAEKTSLVAELDITLLRPGPPGAIVQSGDIDNRLKTLFDALKMPDSEQALPPSVTPRANEDPFFCVLKDDSLITRVNVVTDELLEPVCDSSKVVLLVHVRTKHIELLTGTIGLG